MNIKKALRDLIVGNVGITSRLATYEFTSGVSAPAVFTSPTIPDDAELMAVRLFQLGGPPWGTRDAAGAVVTIDVDLWANKERSDADVSALAADLWELVNRATLTIAGYESVSCQADAPIQTADPDGFVGYTIRTTVRALVE